MQRCAWCGTDPLYQAYHDTEWGKPCFDDRYLFAMLCLEGVGFLAGRQVAVFDLIARAAQEVPGLEAVGAGVLRRHHAVEDGLAAGVLKLVQHLTSPVL